MTTDGVWRKSSWSAPDNCVEVARTATLIAVRDSKNPSNGALVFTASAWRAFLADAKRGEFDLA
jgi:hypothetical protein